MERDPLLRAWLPVGAVNGFLGVAAGAFGAHGLNHVAGALPTIFERAGTYHLIHALAVFGAGLAGSLPGTSVKWIHIACILFLAGILLFCGALYLRGATGSPALLLAAPFGGVAFLLGWLALAFAVWPRRRS